MPLAVFLWMMQPIGRLTAFRGMNCFSICVAGYQPLEKFFQTDRLSALSDRFIRSFFQSAVQILFCRRFLKEYSGADGSGVHNKPSILVKLGLFKAKGTVPGGFHRVGASVEGYPKLAAVGRTEKGIVSRAEYSAAGFKQRTVKLLPQLRIIEIILFIIA